MPAAYDQLIRLISVARGLEAGGYYGAAKLIWALAYSEEVKASNELGIPRGAALTHDLSTIIEDLKADDDLAPAAALAKALEVVRKDTAVPFDAVPEVHVSRTTGDVFIGTPPETTTANDHPLGLREFRPVWFFEPLTPAEVLKALETNPDLFAKQIEGMTAEQLLIAPAPGEWNMRELLMHIYNAQKLCAGRIERLLTEEQPDLAAASTWAEKDKDELSPAEIIAAYRDSRSQMLQRLTAIPFTDWWRPGWHTEFGPQTVLGQATYFARHELSHMPQFAQIRKAALG